MAGRKIRIAFAPVFPHHPSKLARVSSAAVNGIEAFPVEVEVNSGGGDTRTGQFRALAYY